MNSSFVLFCFVLSFSGLDCLVLCISVFCNLLPIFGLRASCVDGEVPDTTSSVPPPVIAFWALMGRKSACRFREHTCKVQSA